MAPGPCSPHFRERCQKDQFRPALDDFERWRPFDPVFGEQSPKGRGLEGTEPDVEAHPNHDDAEQERDAPPPNQELIARDRAEDQHRQSCQQQSGRRPELWPSGNEATMRVRSRPFHRQ